MTDGEPMLSIDDAAQRLGVTRRAVHKYIQQGKLRAFKVPIGNRTLVPLSDVEALLQPKPMDLGNRGNP